MTGNTKKLYKEYAVFRDNNLVWCRPHINTHTIRPYVDYKAYDHN